MFLFIAIGIFSVYVLNVVLGAFGVTTFLSDVGEMITLCIASVAFVVAILDSERAAKQDNNT